VWEETHSHTDLQLVISISIHSPRVGRDIICKITPSSPAISIHSPRVGRDRRGGVCSPDYYVFQSTLPVWEETYCSSSLLCSFQDFNPLSPCGKRRQFNHSRPFVRLFQFTLPVWEETRPDRCRWRFWNISIHSPRVGRDFYAEDAEPGYDISIHSPRVGRDQRLKAAT